MSLDKSNPTNFIDKKYLIKDAIKRQEKDIEKAKHRGEDNGYLEEMAHHLRSLYDGLAV